jgi:hypothetical protein
MARRRRTDTLDAALKAAFQRLESRPLPEHLKLVVDQLQDAEAVRPSPSPPPIPEP